MGLSAGGLSAGGGLMRCLIKSLVGKEIQNVKSAEGLECLWEPTYRFSSHAIVVKPKTRNDKRKQKQLLSESETIVGHVPDTLAEILYPLMTRWKIISVTATVKGNHRAAPEGMWDPDGGIEIPCTYKLYGAKLHKKNVRNIINKKDSKSVFMKYNKGTGTLLFVCLLFFDL